MSDKDSEMSEFLSNVYGDEDVKRFLRTGEVDAEVLEQICHEHFDDDSLYDSLITNTGSPLEVVQNHIAILTHEGVTERSLDFDEALDRAVLAYGVLVYTYKMNLEGWS